MKKSVLAIALAIASMGAQAQDLATPKQLYFVAGMGLTFGGEEIATVTYDKLGDYKLKTGGLVQFTGGVDFRVNSQFSIQSTVSYHVDQANASNGDLKFSRFPIELLAYYHPANNWRVGGGVRYVSSPKLRGSGFGNGMDADFDNTVSGVIEAEYLLNPNFGVKVRYVNESYETTILKKTYKADANHFGVFGNFYF